MRFVPNLKMTNLTKREQFAMAIPSFFYGLICSVAILLVFVTKRPQIWSYEEWFIVITWGVVFGIMMSLSSLAQLQKKG